MIKEQLFQYAGFALGLSLVMMVVSLLRYRKIGPESLFLTGGFATMALILVGIRAEWSDAVRMVLVLILFGFLFLDARSRLGRKR